MWKFKTFPAELFSVVDKEEKISAMVDKKSLSLYILAMENKFVEEFQKEIVQKNPAQKPMVN